MVSLSGDDLSKAAVSPPPAASDDKIRQNNNNTSIEEESTAGIAVDSDSSPPKNQVNSYFEKKRECGRAKKYKDKVTYTKKKREIKSQGTYFPLLLTPHGGAICDLQ